MILGILLHLPLSGLEVFFVDQRSAGSSSGSARSAGVGGPLWGGPSAFFAFRSKAERDKCYEVSEGHWGGGAGGCCLGPQGHTGIFHSPVFEKKTHKMELGPGVGAKWKSLQLPHTI